MSETKGYSALTDEQKVAAKAKQMETMKERWADPVYRANVTQGRAVKAVEKATKALADYDEQLTAGVEGFTAEGRISLVTAVDNANTKLASATEAVEAAKAASAPVTAEV
jgi:hypothetical protein